MNERRRFVKGAAALGLASAAGPFPARAQPAWPTQTIKFVVRFTPGGSSDILARTFGKLLEPMLGQEGFAAFITSELALWGEVIKAAGITASAG